MTQEQKEIAMSFMRVAFLPGSWNKKFAQSMINMAVKETEQELTDSQTEWLYRLLYTYRKQIPDIYSKYQNNPNCKSLKR